MIINFLTPTNAVEEVEINFKKWI